MSMSPAHLYWRYLNTPAWWFGLVFGTVGCLVLAVPYWSATNADEEDRQFAANGVRATAKITFKNQGTQPVGAPGRTPVPFFSVVYLYQDSTGQNHTGSANVTAETWSRHTIGDSISIEYVGDSPDKSRLLAPHTSETPVASVRWWGLGPALICVGLILVLAALLRAWRRTRVIRHGVPALGRVVGTQAAVSWLVQILQMQRANKTLSYYLRYTFTDQSGSAREGLTPELPTDMETRWQPGDPILVLYDPNNVLHHEVDLFGARQQELAALLDQQQTRG